MASVKHAHQIKEKKPNSQVYIFYIDLRAFGKGYEEFFWRTQEEGVNFIRGKPAEIYQKPNNDKLTVKFEDTLMSQINEMDFDLVVLAAGLVQREEADQIHTPCKVAYCRKLDADVYSLGLSLEV